MECAFRTRAGRTTLSLSQWSVALPSHARVKKVLEPRQQSQRHAGLRLSRLLSVKELKRRKTLRAVECSKRHVNARKPTLGWQLYPNLSL